MTNLIEQAINCDDDDRARCFAELGRGEEAKTALDQLAKDFPKRTKEVEDMRRALAAKLPK